MKNVINNRVGLSFALRCMYLLVNVKCNPNSSLKERIKLKLQFSVILKTETFNTFLLKNCLNWIIMKNIKALFSIWLEGNITYALDESIDWAALLIAIFKVFSWLKPRLLIQVFTNCWSTKKFWSLDFFLWILEYISYYNLISRRRQSFSIV